MSSYDSSRAKDSRRKRFFPGHPGNNLGTKGTTSLWQLMGAMMDAEQAG